MSNNILSNNILYLTWIIIDLSILLTAFYIWGKIGIIAIISSNIVLMNIFVLKGMILFGLPATGGNVLYASIFLSTDILEEYFGEKEARKAVFIGFFISLIFFIATTFILAFKPAEWDIYHPAMKKLFTPAWRIIGASMLAYLISQNLDVTTYGWLKKIAPKHLWLRNNGSTCSSQIVDTIVFCSAAFIGVYNTKILMGIIASTYLLKLIVAIIDTPFIYLSKLLVRKKPSILKI